jgi:signal transduction histidine kinase/HD-like signal output (HDOD) protein
MPAIKAESTVARQVEAGVLKLEAISVLPCSISTLFSKLLDDNCEISEVAAIIESDPALLVRLFSLCDDQFPKLCRQCDVAEMVGNLSLQELRKGFYEVELYHGKSDREVLRREMTRFSIAVGCCSRLISYEIGGDIDTNLAYCAGILHGLGNLAIDQEMPESFEKLIAEAKKSGSSLIDVQNRFLGLDFTILGRRLCRKWHLPGNLANGIWLQNCDSNLIADNLAGARLGLILCLAKGLCKDAGIGISGDFGGVDISKAAGSLMLMPEKLEQIKNQVLNLVREKSEILGLNDDISVKQYFTQLHKRTAELLSDNDELSSGNRKLQSSSSHFDFVSDLFEGVDSDMTAMEIASRFAQQWQRFYQTGKVCLYIARQESDEVIEAVLVESLGKVSNYCLEPTYNDSPIPDELYNEFCILNASEHCGWIFDQLLVGFNAQQSKLMPLMSNGRAIGAIISELRYPVDSELVTEKFKVVLSIAGALLDVAKSSMDESRTVELMVDLLSGQEQTPKREGREDKAVEIETTVSKEASETKGGEFDNILEALSEMAAGAAHEFNNPLSVISGRAQLLNEAQTDSDIKRIAEQISENAEKLSRMIEQMLAFAEPASPRRKQVAVRQLIDQAVQLVGVTGKLDDLDVDIIIGDGVDTVYVDSGQLVSALANLITNSLESYGDQGGPVQVTGELLSDVDMVKVSIKDQGCGMDQEVREKAVSPFYSNKAAGRKRGMGLSQAARFVEINSGTMRISSEPGEGTTVEICLAVS